MRRQPLALAAVAFVSVAVAVAGCSLINVDNTTTRIGSPPYTIGSGKAATDNRTLAAFHDVHADNGVSVTVARGSAATAAVTLDDNLVGMLKTTVADGTLTIKVEGNIETHLRLKVAVTTPGAIDALTIGNGSSLDVETLDTPTLDVTVANGSSLHAGGRTTTLTLATLSGSTADLRNVTADTATINVGSGSTARVKATKSATGTCSMGSTLIFHGRPASQSVSSDTSSTVKVE